LTKDQDEVVIPVIHILALGLIGVFAYIVGNVLPEPLYRIMSSFPLGGDTLSHVSKILYMKEYWAFGWYYKEGMGYPYLTLYPPMAYYFAFVLSFLGISAFTLTNSLAFAAIVVSAWAIYWFVTIRFKDLLMAVTSSLFYLIAWSFSTWNGYLAWGFFPQIIATPFMILVFPTFLMWKRTGSKKWFSITTLLAAAALVSHAAVAEAGVVALLLYVLAERCAGEFGWRELKGYLAAMVGAGALSAAWVLPFMYDYPLSGFVFGISQEVAPIQFIEFILAGLPDVSGITIVPVSWIYSASFYYAIVARFMIYSIIVIGVIRAFNWKRRSQSPLPLALLVIFLPLSSLALDYIFFQQTDHLNPVVRFNFANTMMVSVIAGFGVVAIREALQGAFKIVGSVRRRQVLSALLAILILSSSLLFAWSTLTPSISMVSHAEEYPAAEDVARVIGNGRTYLCAVSPYLGGLKQLLPVVSNVPQVGLYFGQGTVIGGWTGYEEGVLFGNLGGTLELENVLKWFGVKYIVLNTDHDPISKYNGSPFREISSGKLGIESYSIIEYDDAEQAITVSTVPAFLVIGSTERDAYTTTLRSVISTNLSPDTALLIKGSGYVDDYTAAELANFQAIILQGYSYHDHDQAWRLLDQYVGNAGRLFIETGWQFVSQDWQSSSIPTPSPVTGTTWSTFENQWSLDYVNPSFAEDVDLSKFPQPVFGGLPRGFSAASSSNIRNWAQPVLSGWGHPLVVAGQYGKGRVIWSGMNLIPESQDAASGGNYEESNFLSNLLSWLIGGINIRAVDHQIVSWEPQKLVLRIGGTTGMTGVFLRQAFFPNWHAYSEYGDQKRELNIYPAGPDLMYVIVSTEGGPTEVTLAYQASTLDTVSLSISLVTLVILGLWVAGKTSFLSRRLKESWKEE